MKIIAFASQKGGVGKTTLAGHIAVEASKDESQVVAIMDTDPQGSLSAWWNIRESDSPLFVSSNINNLPEEINKLSDQGITLLIIDTPPAITESIRKVIAVADLIVIPTRPSPHDLRAVSGTVDITEDVNKPIVFIINGASARAKITSQAAIALSQHGRVCPIHLHHRVDFAASMTDGRTVLEIDPKSKSSMEIVETWKYISKIISK